MNKREKLLALIAGGVFLVTVGTFAVYRFFVEPSRTLDAELRSEIGQLNDLHRQLRQQRAARGRLEEWAVNSFGRDELEIREQTRSFLNTSVTAAGIGSTRLSLSPARGRAVPRAYQSLGWRVQARGSVDQVVKLLHIVDTDPRVHRIDQLELDPVSGGSEVDVVFRYMTLLLLPGADDPPPQSTPQELTPPAERTVPASYAGIARRNLFGHETAAARTAGTTRSGTARSAAGGRTTPSRARTTGVVPPLPGVIPARGRDAAAGAAEPGAVSGVVTTPTFQVVGLPRWGERQEVILLDTAGSKTVDYSIGEELSEADGARIVMVDYRPRPSPANPELLSFSRLVLLVEGEYWTVELGETLTSRRRLEPSEWPPGLSAPAEADAPADEEA